MYRHTYTYFPISKVDAKPIASSLDLYGHTSVYVHFQRELTKHNTIVVI